MGWRGEMARALQTLSRENPVPHFLRPREEESPRRPETGLAPAEENDDLLASLVALSRHGMVDMAVPAP